MKYGFFDDENREYVITRPDTPKPWSNYLGSSEFGGLITNNAAGYTFDYSFYFTGEGKPGKGSFKKMYLYNGLEDSSDNNQDNVCIVCGYDDDINPVYIAGTNWIGQDVSFGLGKILLKTGELQGTVVIKNWIKRKVKQVKGAEDARWIIDGEEE